MPCGKYFSSLLGIVEVSKVPEHTARTMSVGWLASGPIKLAHWLAMHVAASGKA
jgi:hypothetical protein